MTLVCGTDLSEASLPAIRAAAHLAKRMEVALHLVHSVELGSEPHIEQRRNEAERWARAHLQATAARLAEPRGQVQTHVLSAPPDEALEEVAERFDAKLIVVAALGKRRPGVWRLGGHAERLAHRARLPVLMIRDAIPFEAWVNEDRPLRILLGIDMSQPSEAAMDWIRRLAGFGPCDVTAVHLYSPSAQSDRLGLTGVRSPVEPDPVVTATLGREFDAVLRHGLRDVPFALRLEAHVGGIGVRLSAIAAERHSDLVVVGTHGKSGFDPVLFGTVSHSVAHSAEMSVACVPRPATMAPWLRRRPVSVLVATDFSETGNAAVAYAYSIVGRGGTVHLVHVVQDRGPAPVTPGDVFVESGDATSDSAQSSAILKQLGALFRRSGKDSKHARTCSWRMMSRVPFAKPRNGSGRRSSASARVAVPESPKCCWARLRKRSWPARSGPCCSCALHPRRCGRAPVKRVPARGRAACRV